KTGAGVGALQRGEALAPAVEGHLHRYSPNPGKASCRAPRAFFGAAGRLGITPGPSGAPLGGAQPITVRPPS
ncbi:MAG: hypothetical protein KC933_37700, partial [Myxococcales bacterium]|nr:hypothetical protein [Myxococcales bacterium]